MDDEKEINEAYNKILRHVLSRMYNSMFVTGIGVFDIEDSLEVPKEETSETEES